MEQIFETEHSESVIYFYFTWYVTGKREHGTDFMALQC